MLHVSKGSPAEEFQGIFQKAMRDPGKPSNLPRVSLVLCDRQKLEPLRKHRLHGFVGFSKFSLDFKLALMGRHWMVEFSWDLGFIRVSVRV